MPLAVGDRLGQFEILEKLGAGGMGVVYKARDTRLNRLVAIKIIQPERIADTGFQARLSAEARAASSLNQPNVVTVYDAGSLDGVDFIAMEYVPGETLARRIPPHGLPVAEALKIAREVAAALAAAHAAGIVHRDLKPANVMIRQDGVVKVMDFGLAKALAPPQGEEEATRSVRAAGETAPGTVLGTGPYMSPEQAEGKPVDARSDVFSFGAVLFEMLIGRPAFHGDTLISTISAVLKDTPPSVHGLRRDIPQQFDAILGRCLAKNPKERYPTGAELEAALDALAPVATTAGSHRGRIAAAAAAAVILLAGAWWWGLQQSRTRWVYNYALPEFYRLTADQKYIDAIALGQRVRAALPGDPAVELALSRAGATLNLQSQPSGAEIYYRPYLQPTSPEKLLGRTPVKLTLPPALLRVRVFKNGFEDAEGSLEPSGVSEFVLYAKGAQPEGMVNISAGSGAMDSRAIALPQFWLDKFEVTNRQFKAFVDQGGYRKREFWKQPFVKDGSEIPWEEAMRGFVDATGRPGPATWELGSYPENQAQYPVGGVSWYEAAAYAEFAGKSLPSVPHWQRAAGLGLFSEILQLSNFGGRGAAPVGQFQGVGPFGTYDMAGNVREWCFNAFGPRRAILGGGWDEPSYRFGDFQARDPMERLPADGFRCALFREQPPPAAFERIDHPVRDPTTEKPADDATFRAWRNAYAYDASPLDARVESVDDSSEYYRKEKITMAAAYGGERLPAWLFLPKSAAPPYQTVVYYPSGESRLLHDSGWLGPQRQLLFVIRSGRALLYPVYQGTYERNNGSPSGPNALRELLIQRVKDLGRSLDYLSTRKEFDVSRLAYYGISQGCREGVAAVSMEPRIRAAIMVACGIPQSRYPDGTDPLDFAPRFKVPVLLIDGRDDFTFPYATSQLPLFRLLGTPEKDKKMMMHDGGHISAFTPEMLRAALDWLDRYLGPVSERK